VPLVGHEAADEEDVRAAVGEIAGQHRPRLLAVTREVHVDGKDAGAREAGGLQLLPVELAVAKGEVDVPGDGRQLLPADPADAGHLLVPATEELGRSDVVVDEDAAAA